jgi:LysR family glycine cleavage system transcriptional activator
MKFDLPPLGNLPAFEAAARHESFTKAAQELFLTQAAISFQVRNLEEALAVKLFFRHHRSLELTDEGQAMFEAVRAAFKTLAAEKALITGAKLKMAVSLSAPISYASKWLLPRLYRFQESTPEVKILVDANDSAVDLKSSGIHLAIRYCANAPEEFNAIKLLEDDVIPVCSPQLLPETDRHLRPQDLVKMTLLMDQMDDHKWSEWLDAPVGFLNPGLSKKKFSHTGVAIDAAIAGKGLAFGRLPLVADDIDSGRLVRPFQDVGKSGFAYYLLRSNDSLGNPNADAVVSWLKSEAARTLAIFRPAT